MRDLPADQLNQFMDFWVTQGGYLPQGPSRYAGHATKLLEEAIELCLASGAKPEHVGATCRNEIIRQVQRSATPLKSTVADEPDFNNIREEVIDLVLSLTVMHYLLTQERQAPTSGDYTKRLIKLRQRQHVVSPHGVLRRAGRV